MESNVEAIQARNDRAAARELAELRADTVKGLRYALQQSGPEGVITLLKDAGVLSPVFDRFMDDRREDAR